MAEKALDDLIDRMPEIAKVVNEFSNAALQEKAFEALMRAASASHEGTTPVPPHSDETGTQNKEKAKDRKKTSGTLSVRRTRDTLQVVDVDLYPKGKPSLKDFIASKKPRSDPEKYISIIYYMTNFAGVDSVTPEHIYTAYKQLGEKVPNIYQGLNNARGRHSWLTFKGLGPISLTRIGENVVEHDLPRERVSNENG